jgi:AraC-like DNA-binding protein
VTPLRRIEFASSDPLEIRDFLHRVRGSQVLVNGVRDRDWRVSLNQVDAGEFSASEMQLPGDITFRMSGRDEVVIHTILGGRSRLDHGQASHRYQSGHAYVASCPRVDFTCRTHEVRTRTITLPQSLLTEVASRPWQSTVQRAVSFIEANADIDITIADIARAAGVTARAVQLAFRRHLDITPAGYLRWVRLDRAHRQLQAADPDHDSVTAVAYRWGFSSPSRFATYYRQAYGVPPSRTLRN